jgi:hypothetical protein
MGIPFFALAVASDILFAALCVPFIGALKAEAPDIYKEIGEPSVAKYVWFHKYPKPFSTLISSGSYRIALANFRRPKAWASWLFVAYWLRMAAWAAFIISIIPMATQHDL